MFKTGRMKKCISYVAPNLFSFAWRINQRILNGTTKCEEALSEFDYNLSALVYLFKINIISPLQFIGFVLNQANTYVTTFILQNNHHKERERLSYCFS